MDEILNATLEEMGTISFDCSCGKHHQMSIEKLIMGKGVLSRICEIAEPFRNGKILMVSDNHTYDAAGEKVLELLEGDESDLRFR